MKTFELNKKSWHYWLANFGDHRIWNDETDICHYIRSVFWGTFWFIIISIISVIIGGSVLFAIGNMFSWLFLGYELHNVTFFVFSMIFSLGALFVYVCGKEYYTQTMSDKPGFIRLAYRSWKDKFCAKVVLK